MKIFAGLFLLFVFSGLNFGQSEQIVKGDIVVPKFTAKSLNFDKLKVWSARSQYAANITKISGELLINGVPDWADSDFPFIKDFQVKEFEISKKKPARVLLIAQSVQIEINIPNDLNAAEVLSALLYKGASDSFINSEYFQSLESKILPRIFKNEIAAIPFKTQQQLIRDVDFSYDAYGLDTFKDQRYFVVNFSDNLIYNTIQINSAQRAARQTESALKKLKEVIKKTGKIKDIQGIKATTTIASRDFLREKYSKPHEEKFEMFTSFDLLQKFVDAEITNQELADGSVILIDGNRVKVNLTNF